MTEERWKPWPFATHVEASTLGRIRIGSRILTGKASGGKAYLRVEVQLAGPRTRVKVHRIVCDTWVGLLPSGMHRAHLDGDPTNNRADNLVIVDPRTNMVDHRQAQGQSPIWKLSPDQAREICDRFARGETNKCALGRMFGVTSETVRHHLHQAGLYESVRYPRVPHSACQ